MKLDIASEASTNPRFSARGEGVAIAQDMLVTLLPHIQGAQISAPFGRYKTAIDVAGVIPERRWPSARSAD